MTIAFTGPLRLGSKVVSNAPVDVTRAILFLVTPPTVVNAPPTITQPSDCSHSAFTVPFASGSKVASNSPILRGYEISQIDGVAKVTLATRFLAKPSICTNAPPR